MSLLLPVAVRRTIAPLLLAAAWLASAQTTPVTIRLAGEPPRFKVENSGIIQRINNPNYERIFKVYVVQADGSLGPEPMAGDYAVERNQLFFKPRYKLEPGMTYRAVFKLADEAGRYEVTIPKPTYVATTYVERVYPSAKVLPENQLKFYIHFSAPMSRGEAAKRLHLFEEGGIEVKLPFLEIDEELWDKQQRRITVLFDPGRVKTGVTPNQEVGLALKSGRRYTLMIDEEWKDAKEIPLKGAFKKEFAVGPADRSPIEPKAWQFDLPTAGSSDSLRVRLLEPLDAALLQRFLDVADSNGQLVNGKVTIEDDETSWVFKPDQPWVAGKHSLEILKSLEDLAGNKIGRTFEVDRVEQPAAADATGAEASLTYSLPFSIPAPATAEAPAPAPPAAPAAVPPPAAAPAKQQ